LVVSHFVAILVTYSANWRRSSIQDDMLTLGQPYLIGLNWYVEMLPIEWNRADSADLKTRLSVQEKNTAERLVLLDSSADTVDRAKKRNLLRLLVSILEAGDDDGAALLLSSIIKHEQSSTTRIKNPIVSVRLEKLLDAGDANYSVLYDATVKQSSDGKVQFLPALEPQRTVPAIRSETSAAPS
jgi:ABC-type cobalamin transport system ATPase subunit